MRKFLTAEWRDLIMVNYEVGVSLLADRLPPGTEIDLYDERCFVSLVGFMFLNTRVLGIPIPFHVNFEEVNLRFYVRRTVDDEVRRGVCFVKEIVPRTAIAQVARIAYGEPYERWRMSHTREPETVSYSWSRPGCSNQLQVTIDKDLGVPPPNSHGEFIIEHYWGYTKRRHGIVDEYRVEHPKWDLFSTKGQRIDVDFGSTYGEEFAFLGDAAPYSVLLAKGSPIAVYKGSSLLG